MTNKQWLIWRLIDMSDEEFADRVCGQRDVWSCGDCLHNEINDYPGCQDCRERLHEWLKQEAGNE